VACKEQDGEIARQDKIARTIFVLQGLDFIVEHRAVFHARAACFIICIDCMQKTRFGVCHKKYLLFDPRMNNYVLHYVMNSPQSFIIHAYIKPNIFLGVL
jgi:hypothetical protein